MLCVLGIQHTRELLEVVVGILFAKWLGMYTYIWIQHKGHCVNDYNRSHAASCTVWTYHLYLVAVGTLPEVQGFTYKKLYITFSPPLFNH